MADDREMVRERNRVLWESGDWDEVADTMALAGHRLLDRIAGLGAGVRLLDVATGSGGAVAIPAAQRGADVVGADLTDAAFPAARRRADAAGVTVRWVVCDAVSMPFDDGSFDVVTSTFGHMFAPDQQAAAHELVRVCRPGGTIALACWSPTSNFARFIATLVIAMGPPPGFVPPVLWGSEPHVRELLEPLGVTLDMQPATLTMIYDSPAGQVDHWEAHFPPVVAAKAALGDQRWPATRDALLALFKEINQREDGSMAADYAYLETLGRTASS